MLQLLAAGAGLLGSLFGNKSKQSESFERDSTTNSTANMKDLSPALLKALEGLLGGELASGKMQDASGSIQDRLKQLMQQANGPQFDVDAFAQGITNQAISAAGLEQESAINQTLSAAGASEGGNSMSALLGNKVRNATAANIGGVAANATAQGEQIRMAQQGQLTEGINALGGTLSQQILGLLGGTRGANQTSTGTVTEKSKGKGNVSSSSSGNPFSALAGIFGAFNDAKKNA